MKTKLFIKRVVITAVIICSLVIKHNPLLAQTGTSLKMNQVLFLSANADNTGAQWTVPAGKVWKINMMGGCHQGGSNSTNNCDMIVFLNSTRAFWYCGWYNYSTNAGPSYRFSDSQGDIWLPENTTFGTLCQSSSTSNRWLSVTEFNVQ